MSWDEPAQQKIGTISYNYIVHGDNELEDFHDADYGVGFELPLIFIEKILGLEDNSEIFKMRHLVSHFFFILCLYCGFWLIYKMFGSVWLAAVGVLLFVLNPVIYAHSFFNTKDIPFMSVYLVCFFFIYHGFKNYRYLFFALSGVALGFLVNLRIMGILLLSMVLALVLADLIINRKDREFQLRILRSGLIFLLAFCTTLYFSWPYLYENPIEKFVAAFNNMSRFRWQGAVLYLGDMITATELPWHYIIVWFGITTPIVFLALGLSGIGMAIYQLLKKPFRIFQNDIRRHLMIYLVCLLAPILAVIVLNSVLYDGWRHLYFVYPPFVLLAVYFLSRIRHRQIAFIVTPALMLSFIFSAYFMFKNHPFQQVYFNHLVKNQEQNDIRKKFEMDYWGVSYLQGIQEVLKRDSVNPVKMSFANMSGVFNVVYMLPAEDKARIVITEEDPKYFLTDYRFHPEDYPYDESQKIYSIEVQNNTILSVFRLRD